MDFVAALEGGPVVIVAELENRSTASIRFSCRPRGDRSVALKHDWPGKVAIEFRIGLRDAGTAAERVLAPGERLHYVYAAHEQWEPRAGNYPVRAQWIVRHPPGGFGAGLPPPIVEMKATGTLQVAQRTDAHVGTLVRSLNGRIDRARTAADYRLIGTCLEGVALPALEPIARRLIARDTESRGRAILWMFQFLPSDRACGNALAEVRQPAARDPHEWLDAWRMHATKHPPTSEQYRLLRTAPNIWARLSALLCFPDAFDKDQSAALLREASAFQSTLSVDQVRLLVGQLDDRMFQKREEASRRLVGFGGRAIPALRQLAGASVSVEVRARLETVVAEIERHRENEPGLRFVDQIPDYFGNYPNVRPILEALVQNSPESPVTAHARRAIARLADKEKMEEKD